MTAEANQTVLVVEDSWLLAAEVEFWLQKEGLTVAGPAANVSDALRIMERDQPKYALVDFNLGGEMSDGLIDRLRERDISVIVVTGYSDVSRIPDDVVTVLQKPCSKDQVMRALSAAGLQRRAAP